MPFEIKKPVTEFAIINVIYLWLDLLAGEKYEEAYNLTMQDPYYQWTPYLIQQVINGYGLPIEESGQAKYKVSNWRLAKSNFQSNKPYKEVNFRDDKLDHF